MKSYVRLKPRVPIELKKTVGLIGRRKVKCISVGSPPHNVIVDIYVGPEVVVHCPYNDKSKPWLCKSSKKRCVWYFANT